VLDGERLRFVYAGTNNQNFVMRDVQTDTWWQQVTGEAIIGPRAGERLEPLFSQEVNFGIFGREHPEGLVLHPEPELLEQGAYPLERYRLSEEEVARGRPRPSWFAPESDVALEARDLVVDVRIGDRSKAYPLDLLVEQNPLQDHFAGVPLVLLVAADGKTVRAFDRRVDGETLDLYRPVPETGPSRFSGDGPVLVDGTTGSRWDFSGRATGGPLAGTRLEPLLTVRDYWFDWRRHHPEGPVYVAGRR